jgi:DNA-binding response OmpR family regulator
MRILVVEDEPLLAMLLEQNLSELGHDLVGAAATVDQALAILDESSVDCALLDFTLAGDATSAPVARRLALEGTPFVYLSGHASFEPDNDAPDAPLVTKPISMDELRMALSDMAALA